MRLLTFLAVIFITIPLSAQQNTFGNQNDFYSTTTEVELDCDDGFEVHPVDDDFNNGYEGRVMISTLHDEPNDPDRYYTDYQTGDAFVTIEAIVPSSFAGQTIYFELVDPDIDDKSSYEKNPDGSENEEPGDNFGGLGTLSDTEKNAANFISVEGGQMKMGAAVTLTITGQHSGDNYQVKIKVDDPNNAGQELVVGETSVMVAWKRFYLEVDRMYKKGATLTSDFNLDTDMSDDIVGVDNTSDFEAGQEVTFFSWDENVSNYDATIVSVINETTLLIKDESTEIKTFKTYSGIKIKNNNNLVADVSGSYLEMAFGEGTDGDDGGCFVEFKDFPLGSESIPKYCKFVDGDVIIGFVSSWRTSTKVSPPNFSDNYVQIEIIHEADLPGEGPFLGTSEVEFNFTLLASENFPSITKYKIGGGEVTVHELGHQLVNTNANIFPHFHSNESKPEYENHEGTDQAVMSYAREYYDRIAEFHLQTIYYIRNNVTLF